MGHQILNLPDDLDHQRDLDGLEFALTSNQLSDNASETFEPRAEPLLETLADRVPKQLKGDSCTGLQKTKERC